MSGEPQKPVPAWGQALQAARLFAADPHGTGLCIRARPGPQRDRLLDILRGLLGGIPIRKLPLSIADDRLLGGLDLAATLAAGTLVPERGLLAEADGGVIVIPSAERISPALAGRLAAVHDRGETRLERDGLMRRFPARFGLVLLDEGLDGDEGASDALLDRVAFRIDLTGASWRETEETSAESEKPIRPMPHARHIDTQDAIRPLVEACATLGIDSARAALLALRAARLSASLAGRRDVSGADLALAGQLVLAWRAKALPETEDEDDETEEPEQNPPDERPDAEMQDPQPDGEGLKDVVLKAARAALPADLLARLEAEQRAAARHGAAGRSGAKRKSARRGRRTGILRGDPRSGARLDLIATLRAAVPWQKLRQNRTVAPLSAQKRNALLEIRASDFRTIRFAERSETLTVFAVDASGSQALHRMAEAKGAVELLLADCYIRRDQVAVVAFRGKSADILLPPTRSLVRAKRSLSSLPAGGGTPLASGIDAAAALAASAQRRGQTVLIVLLTDGRANIARGGEGQRAQAQTDASASARLVASSGIRALLIDTASQPEPRAKQLAAEMGALYLPLPRADAAALSGAVRRAQSRTPAYV